MKTMLGERIINSFSYEHDIPCRHLWDNMIGSDAMVLYFDHQLL